MIYYELYINFIFPCYRRISVISAELDGWWKIKHEQQIGLIPKMKICPLAMLEEKL